MAHAVLFGAESYNGQYLLDQPIRRHKHPHFESPRLSSKKLNKNGLSTCAAFALALPHEVLEYQTLQTLSSTQTTALRTIQGSYKMMVARREWPVVDEAVRDTRPPTR